MAPPPVRLCNLRLPSIPASVHEKQQNARYEKEDAIHYAKCKARLQHRAILIGIEMEGRISADAIIIDGHGEVTVCGEACAVCVGDVAKFVDAGDEGADEAEVDEGDEDGGIAGGFATENGYDGPGGGQDGDDEENTGGLRKFWGNLEKALEERLTEHSLV